ncbi:hypothetical protein A0H81_13295 [Grifola frondosa]|uniref:Uncharacterized protein n=1 Tax=Grifola frondosa TaxID=5627 RepID=A0A1C7LPX7_GRIFR|nr:hypothetical protein A0H81_13295 [Grifola frondosa]
MSMRTSSDIHIVRTSLTFRSLYIGFSDPPRGSEYYIWCINYPIPPQRIECLITVRSSGGHAQGDMVLHAYYPSPPSVQSTQGMTRYYRHLALVLIAGLLCIITISLAGCHLYQVGLQRELNVSSTLTQTLRAQLPGQNSVDCIAALDTMKESENPVERTVYFCGGS